MSEGEIEPCPACGGAGGGPLGRAGGAWDTEDYVCPRCKGAGVFIVDVAAPIRASVPRPGLTKTREASEGDGSKQATPPTKKKAAGDLS